MNTTFHGRERLHCPMAIAKLADAGQELSLAEICVYLSAVEGRNVMRQSVEKAHNNGLRKLREALKGLVCCDED